MSRCGYRPAASTRCDAVDVARRWTVADAQNQVAWVALSAVLRQRGDGPGARAAFERAAQASLWHEHAWDVARLLDGAAPRDFPPLERLGWALQALSTGFAVAFPDYRTIRVFCKEGAVGVGSLKAACLRIADTMMRDAESSLTLSVAPNLAASGGASDDVVTAYRRKADAIHWAVTQAAMRDAIPSSFDVDDAVASRALPEVAALVADSERVRGERYLLSHRVAEDDAARRYVETLSPQVREWRAKALAEARQADPGPAAVSAGSTRSTAASR